MLSPAFETANEVLLGLKQNPDTNINAVYDEITELFAVIPKDEQRQFCCNFYNWANPRRKKYPLIFCYARHLKLVYNFHGEQHETVLTEGPLVSQALEELNEPAAAASVGTFIGSVHRTLGNMDLALKSLWDGYRQLHHYNRFPHYKLACSYHIGSIYMELKNFEEALPILQKTLDEASQKQDSVFIVYTSEALGKLYLKQEKFENARLMFQQALDTACKTGTPYLISSAETEMGNYYFETGNYSNAEKMHTSAANARIANNFLGGTITNYMRLGEIYIKQSQPDKAIIILNKGLVLAEQTKVKPKMFQVHLLLSEIYHCKNDLPQSFFHYKQYHLLQEQAGQEDNARKVKNVKLVFEAEQTKKENTIIRQQKKEIEKKNRELQETIDELTITKAGKKAKAFTLLIAILLFIIEDSILHFVFHIVPANDFWLSLGIKILIIFSLKPINGAIEHRLVKKIIRKKKKAFDAEDETEDAPELELAL